MVRVSGISGLDLGKLSTKAHEKTVQRGSFDLHFKKKNWRDRALSEDEVGKMHCFIDSLLYILWFIGSLIH
jgi:hypothetical protein